MNQKLSTTGTPGNGSFHISIRGLSYEYPGNETKVLTGIDLDVAPGTYLVILGANGSGKSTLLKCLNGVCPVSPGMVRIHDHAGRCMDPSVDLQLRALRSILATVLQNPDDQIVGTVVEEDCAFGPENLGLSEDEVLARVDKALTAVGLTEQRRKPPQFLSGGERQRLAIAGVLALEPQIIAFDEATAMIDPSGREALLSIFDNLSAAGKTILTVTHSLEEASRADRCIVLHGGRIVFDGMSRELFLRDELETWGFVLPVPLGAYRALQYRYPGFTSNFWNPIELAASILPFMRKDPKLCAEALPETSISENPHVAVQCRKLNHQYLTGTEYSAEGLRDVDFNLKRGQSLAVIGPAGSGKTTLLKHLNALLLPTQGSVRIFGLDTLDRSVDLCKLRFTSVLGVQNPEAAFFEPYVADDVAYGPRNAGLRGSALVDRVREALDSVDLPYAQFGNRLSRSLSGGEKRRAALAGVFALKGELLALDEPTASLDGEGRERVLGVIDSLRASGHTVIVVTHSMEEAARYELLAVMDGGKLVYYGPPGMYFKKQWEAIRDGVPWTVAFHGALVEEGLCTPGPVPLNLKALLAALWEKNTTAVTPERTMVSDSVPRYTQELREKGKKKKLRKGTGIEFFRNITLGQFLDIPSTLRSLSGGVKLMSTLILASLILVMGHPAPILVLLPLVLLVGHSAGRIKPKHLLRGLIPAAPYIALMAALQLLFSWPGDTSQILGSIGPISVTIQELSRASLLVTRLGALMALLSLFSAVTAPSEALRAASRLLQPLASLGIPVRDLILIFGIALRFVPILAEEAERITIAQLSRGGTYGGKGRIRAAAAILVPLFLRALERSETLAMAMELRLFNVDTHSS